MLAPIGTTNWELTGELRPALTRIFKRVYVEAKEMRFVGRPVGNGPLRFSGTKTFRWRRATALDLVEIARIRKIGIGAAI